MTTILSISFIIASTLITLLTIAYTLYTGISPMPSSQKAIEAIVASLPKNFSGTIIETGSGWGGLAHTLAKKFPRSNVIGYELSPIPFYFSCLRILPNLTFYRKNFFHTNFSKAQAVVCYLYPKAMSSLKEKLSLELPTNALVISNTFAMPSWKPSKTYHLKTLTPYNIYYYDHTSR